MTRVGWLIAVVVGASAVADAKSAPGWVDEPAWPAGGVMELTWLVYPIKDASQPETTKAPLDLIATIGGTMRRIKLAPQFGALSPINQAACAGTIVNGQEQIVQYPLGRGEVAKITFYEGGAGGYFVRRSGDVLSVVAWELGDGACSDKHGEPRPCPRSEKPVIKLHVPKAVKITQRIFEVDDQGARHPFDCTMR